MKPEIWGEMVGEVGSMQVEETDQLQVVVGGIVDEGDLFENGSCFSLLS